MSRIQKKIEGLPPTRGFWDASFLIFMIILNEKVDLHEQTDFLSTKKICIGNENFDRSRAC